MKKDIQIPIVKDVYIVALQDTIEGSSSKEWNAYIINDKPIGIELVIIVSEGFSKNEKTSILRKTINFLPKKSYAKLEMIPEDLFKLENRYKVSYFEDNRLYDKTFTFKKNSIRTTALGHVPLLEKKGILAE